LVLYTLLMLPLAYVMGITSLSRRILYYKAVVTIFAPLIGLFVLDRLFVRIWPFYKRATLPYRHKLAGVLGVVANVLLTATLLFPMAIVGLIGFGLSPIPFVVLAVVLFVALILQFALKARYPKPLRLDIPMIQLFFIYTALAVWAHHYLGSTDAACEQVVSSRYLAPIVTREDIARAPGIESCYPYDVKSDPSADMLFFTLKQKRAGFVKIVGPQRVANDAICATSLSSPRLDSSMIIPIVGESTGAYPQRITVNPDRKEIYVVVLDIDGNHSVKVVSYDGEWRVVRSIALDYEPIRVYIDRDRARLIILDYEGGVGVYDLETYEQRFFRKLDSIGFFGMIDTIVANRDRSAYYTSVVSQNFLLLDAETFDTLFVRRLGVPTIGLDYDEAANRVYVAGTFSREILVLDGDTLEMVDRIRTGITARELYLHRKRRLIITAGYADGHLDIYDLDGYRRLARLFVGKLARGLHIEQSSGRVFVTSSCGLFEVRLDRLLSGGDRAPEP